MTQTQQIEQDTYYVESPTLTEFIRQVRQVMDEEPDNVRRVQRLRSTFAGILADQEWLPAEYRSPDPSGGMGGNIGNYLIYRCATGDLSLSALVLPPGSTTPVHDHLVWGLVGLYSGEQDEWVYARTDDARDEQTADLAEVERRHLHAGEFYELLPPDGDIHRVQATGTEPSISLHLLGNDVGCVWRHRFEPETHSVHPFRSAYSNHPCSDEATPSPSSS